MKTERIEAFAREKPRLFLAGLIGGVAAIRVFWLLEAAALLNANPLDLSFFYDGLAYIHIAQTFPHVYGPPPQGFPLAHPNAALYAIYLPGPAAIIAGLQLFLGDGRLAALAATQLCAAASIAVFYKIAKKLLAAPACAAIVFSLFTPTWFLCGTLPFAESLLVLLFLGSFFLWLDGRLWAAAAAAALAPLAQKSGVFLLVLLPAWEYLRTKCFVLGPTLAAWVPLALLQAYFWLTFGDPLVAARLLGKLYNGIPIPFYAMISGLFSGEQIFTGSFLLRKAAIGLSCAFYLSVLIVAWRRREKRLRPLVLWLGVALAFNLSLRGMWAYYAFPRFMLWALPPAILLMFAAVPKVWAGRLAIATLAAVPATLAIVTGDLLSAIDLLIRIWKPGFFQALSAYFR